VVEAEDVVTADPPLWQFWLNWWVQAAVALATFLAVLVALFQPFLPGWFPPKLSLRLLSPVGEKTRSRLQWSDGLQIHGRDEDSRYYHLQVSNQRRWSPAHDVQVMLLQLEQPAANGEFQTTWTGSIPLQWRHQTVYPVLRTIGASPAEADLCSVVKGKWLELHPLVAPNILQVRFRERCSFVVVVQAQAREATSRAIRLHIAWDGQWHDGDQEMRQHLVVQQLEV
jgi:hypothetical protein